MSTCQVCGGTIPQAGCETEDPCVCEAPTRRTYCDGDTRNNVWLEKAPDSPDAVGICMLDTMTETQVVYCIQRDPIARRDLLTVTTDPHLRYLALTVPELPAVEESDQEQALLNKPAQSIPFYTQFRGQPPYNG